MLFYSRGGICIWSASYPGNAASVRSGIASSLGTVARSSGVRWILVDILRSPHDELVTALSWNPDGRYPNCLAGKLLICLFMLFLFSFPILFLRNFRDSEYGICGKTYDALYVILFLRYLVRCLFTKKLTTKPLSGTLFATFSETN